MKKRVYYRWKHLFGRVGLLALFVGICIGNIQAEEVEKWKIFELTLHAEVKGNPYTDTRLSARFIQANDTVCVDGFTTVVIRTKCVSCPVKRGSGNMKLVATSVS